MTYQSSCKFKPQDRTTEVAASLAAGKGVAYPVRMEKTIRCPHCGKGFPQFANPAPTTDAVVHDPARGIVLIRRARPPLGYALPGGFIDEGEQAEQAARRELREETGLDVRLTGVLGVYSRPSRDPRFHTLSVVFVGDAEPGSVPAAGDDAAEAAFFPLDALPSPLAFDHATIIRDFRAYLAGKRPLAPVEKED